MYTVTGKINLEAINLGRVAVMVQDRKLPKEAYSVMRGSCEQIKAM